jgi:hypothetical protein
VRAAILSLVVVFIVMPAPMRGEETEKLYFLGEVKLSSAAGQPMGSQVIVLEKTHDRESSTIIESAIVVDASGKAEERTMRLVVKPDNTFTLSDDAKTIEGTGTLFGPAWKWTYFKGTFKSKSGVTVEDENFMTDDAVITARKKILGPDNKVLMYMEMSLNRITPNTFEILKAGLLKK